MTIRGFPLASESGVNPEQHRREIARAANRALGGKLNNIAEVTLTASVASTTVTDSRVSTQSFIGFMPTTANAATEIFGATMYVSTRSDGSFVITHANNAQVDRSFVYAILG